MKNNLFFEQVKGYEIKLGETFASILDNFQEAYKTQVLHFSNENGEIYQLQDIAKSNNFVWPVTKMEIAANLLNIFSFIITDPIFDFFIEDGFCWIKFKTENTYSEKDFDKYKNMILSYNENVNLDGNPLISVCGPFLNQLPYDFQLEKVAQEESKGLKIQKFSFALFFNDQMKKSYLEHIKELKLDDHRYIGLHQNLFMMIPEAAGSVFWLPNGWKLFRNLEKFIRAHGYIGYNEVKTPFVMSNKFWIKSGHMASFKKNMMFVTMGESEEDNSALKPMNCPAHIEIFKQKNRSYRDLPYRIAEFGCCHRYEPSGSLHGLMRVRSLTQDDGHIFCSLDQVKDETLRFLKTCVIVYEKLGFNEIKVVLSTKPENALGDPNDWIKAEEYLQASLCEAGLIYEIAAGEGAFYGPKIEMHVKDSLKRSWQLGTIQLDFVLPNRFELEYVKSDDTKGKICMLHRAILGSLERFIGVFLEHNHGKIPLFLAPIQISICTITSDVDDYAKLVFNKLEEIGLSAVLDDRNEKLQAKIREAKLSKIPMLIVIGKKEKEQKIVKAQYQDQDYLYKIDNLNDLKRFINDSK